MLTIADRIKYFRKQRGLTQAQLAAMTGIHPVSIRKYETNKMQPQSAQIERIAEALQVNSGAISGSHSEIIRLETVGDLMGLLMVWHKSGILRLVGTRDENGRLDPDAMQLLPNKAFQHYFSVLSGDGEVLSSFDLKLKLSEENLHSLLEWEYLYNQCRLHMDQAFLTNDLVAGFSSNKFVEELQRMEMQLQSSLEDLQ